MCPNFEKWIIVVQTNSTLCAGREDARHTFEGMSWWTACGPWWCKAHHNIPKEVLLLAQLKGWCGGVREDLFNLSTKPDPQQEASGFVATLANSRRAVGKCVNGFYGKFAPFKRVWCHHGCAHPTPAWHTSCQNLPRILFPKLFLPWSGWLDHPHKATHVPSPWQSHF